MTHTSRQFIWASLISILSFVFYTQNAFAYIDAQLLDSSNENLSYATSPYTQFTWPIASSTSGNLSQVRLKVNDNGIPVVMQLYLYNSSGLLIGLIGTTTTTGNSATTSYVFSSSTPYDLNSSVDYLISLFTGGDGGPSAYPLHIISGAARWTFCGDFSTQCYPPPIAPYFVADSNSSDTNTRFVNIYPAASSTVATSTPSDAGADLYINPADYVDGMYLEYSFTNQTVSYVGGSALDAFNAAFGNGNNVRLPITSSGSIINVATSTHFLYPGVTKGSYRIVTPSFLSSLWLVGSYFNGNILVASSSTFTVGARTGVDDAIDQGALATWLVTGTTSVPILPHCHPNSFDLETCLISVVIPDSGILLNDFNQVKDGFLTRAPIGYATRLISILSNASTTTPLPTFTATFPTGPGSGPISTSSITFDMDDMIAGGGALLNSIHDPVSGQNVQEITEPWIRLLIALLTLIIIVRDVTAMKPRT